MQKVKMIAQGRVQGVGFRWGADTKSRSRTRWHYGSCLE